MSSTAIQVDDKVKVKVSMPKMWKVIFVNDDTTPMDFVILLLTDVFKHSEDSANELTMQVHTSGSAVVGVYSFEIAESKAVESTTLARNSGYPLQIKIESEE